MLGHFRRSDNRGSTGSSHAVSSCRRAPPRSERRGSNSLTHTRTGRVCRGTSGRHAAGRAARASRRGASVAPCPTAAEAGGTSAFRAAWFASVVSDRQTGDEAESSHSSSSPHTCYFWCRRGPSQPRGAERRGGVCCVSTCPAAEGASRGQLFSWLWRPRGFICLAASLIFLSPAFSIPLSLAYT